MELGSPADLFNLASAVSGRRRNDACTYANLTARHTQDQKVKLSKEVDAKCAGKASREPTDLQGVAFPNGSSKLGQSIVAPEDLSGGSY